MTATGARNICPTATKRHASLTSDVSPFEAYYGRRPRIQRAHIFGSLCFALQLARERNKLHSATPAIYLRTVETGYLVEELDAKYRRTGETVH